VFNPPHPKLQSFDKAEPNSHFRGMYIRSNLIRIWVSISISILFYFRRCYEQDMGNVMFIILSITYHHLKDGHKQTTKAGTAL
jgi:hypothetical protein